MIFQIEDKIISSEVFDKCFECDIEQCKGVCCVDGDAGAPLEENEIVELQNHYETIKPYLKTESIESIEKYWLCYQDEDGDFITPCNEDGSCVYLIEENGINLCVFEKLYFEKKIKFRKPISCHLFPIRLMQYSNYTAVNFHQREICQRAIEKGENNNMPVFIFLKDALIRKFGEEFYNEMKILNEHYKNQK